MARATFAPDLKLILKSVFRRWDDVPDIICPRAARRGNKVEPAEGGSFGSPLRHFPKAVRIVAEDVVARETSGTSPLLLDRGCFLYRQSERASGSIHQSVCETTASSNGTSQVSSWLPPGWSVPLADYVAQVKAPFMVKLQQCRPQSARPLQSIDTV